MSTSLRLTVPEFDRMIATGAFDRLERRIEFIHGEICEMSPAGPIHDDYIQFLIGWSQQICQSGEAVLRVHSGLLVGESIPEPDLCLLKPRRYFDRRVCADDALLLIEVADSSLEFELGDKARLYAADGIKEYWVIDVTESKLHRYQEPSSEGYGKAEVFGRSESLTPAVFPNARLQLSDLFIADLG